MQLNRLILLLFAVKLAELRPLPRWQNVSTLAEVGAKVFVPPSRQVTLGSTVTLDCMALIYKTPLGGLEWTEGAVAIRGAEGRVYINGSQLTHLRLTINKFRLTDVGEYTCSLRTAWNQTVSATTSLTAKGQEGITVFERFQLSHNTSHTTACNSSGIVYHKQLLHGKITTIPSPHLALTKLSKLADQSKVMCITDAGLIQRVEYILADYKPITFLQPAINDTELPYKNNYNIPCTAMGHPQPQLSWLKIDDADNTEIKLIFQSGYIEVVKEQASLILRFPTYFGFIQHGKFACRANNVWESSTQVIRLPQLPVTPPPAEWFDFETFEVPSEVKAGETLTVTCSGRADSFLGVHGFIQHLNTTTSSTQANGRVVFSEKAVNSSLKTFSLTIHNTSEADAGMYQCALYSVKLFITLWSEPLQVSII